jgi:hypothetical protein
VPFKHYKTKDCFLCPVKTQCTSSPRGRIIQKSIFQSAIDRNNARVNSDPDYYRYRQQIIEHQFATIKRQWGFTHVLMRGKKHVLAEVSILFTAYNLKRSLSIIGFSELLKRLKTLLLNIWTILIIRTVVDAHSLVNIFRAMIHNGSMNPKFDQYILDIRRLCTDSLYLLFETNAYINFKQIIF